MKAPIYLDHHATTPLDPRVLKVMEESLREHYGNPSSTNHVYGARAQAVVEAARESVANLIGAEADEVIFTSGATEGNNLALKGLAEVYREKGRHIISQVTEHSSVLEVLKHLETKGFQVTYLPVAEDGRVDVKEIEAAMTEQTILISVMFANNEIGTIQPIAEIGRLAKAKEVFFHVDGAQAVGKIPCDVERLGVDLLTCSAHKFYGPKGVGALYLRKANPRVRIEPLVLGGGHEGGLRSGTLNVPAIRGMGEACAIAKAEMQAEELRLKTLSAALLEGIKKELSGVFLHGSTTHRLGQNLNLSFRDVDGAELLKRLSPKMAVSTGSACATMSGKPSHVLKAIGVPEALLHASIRIGLGRLTTAEEIEFVKNEIVNAVKDLRKSNPF